VERCGYACAVDPAETRRLREWIMLNSQAAQGGASLDKAALRAAGVLVTPHTHKNVCVGLSNMSYEGGDALALRAIVAQCGGAAAAVVRLNSWIRNISQTSLHSHAEHLAALTGSLRYASAVHVPVDAAPGDPAPAITHNHAATPADCTPPQPLVDPRDFPKALADVQARLPAEQLLLRRAAEMAVLQVANRDVAVLLADRDDDLPVSLSVREFEGLMGLDTGAPRPRVKDEPMVHLRLARALTVPDAYDLAVESGAGSNLPFFLGRLQQQAVLAPEQHPPAQTLEELADRVRADMMRQ
jgi:hypothetical protein